MVTRAITPAGETLNARQRKLIELLIEGVPVKRASELAGYAGEGSARAALLSSNVRIALDAALHSRLADGAGAALSFLEAAFRGQIPNLSGAARVTAAIAWLDRAGLPVPRGVALEKSSDSKSLSEMSLAELRVAVAELKAIKASGPSPDATLDDMLA